MKFGVGTARKLCPKEFVMEADYNFTQKLKSSNNYKILNNILILYHDGEKLMTFKKINI